MNEKNDYRASDIVFPFVFGYGDSWMGFDDTAQLTKIHVQHTELNNRATSQNYSKGWSTEDLADMHKSVSTFKNSFWALFVPHCDNCINTVKFHLLDHFVDDLERFKIIHVLSESPY